MKKTISITVDYETLKKFDSELEQRLICRSKIFDCLMKDKLDNWEKVGVNNGY